MGRRFVRGVGVALLVGAVAAAAGCDDDAEGGSAPALTIALGIDGSGSVRSTPAAIDCTGPRDCGSQTITGTSIVLRAVAASGFTLSRWTIGGSDTAAGQTELTVTGVAGETKVVRAVFVQGSGGGDVPGGNPPGSSPDGGPEAGAGPQCGASTCAAGEKCCFAREGDHAMACKSICAPTDFEPACTTADGCEANEVCCLEADGNPSGEKAVAVNALTCKTTRSCLNGGLGVFGAPLCSGSGSSTCPGGAGCNGFGVSVDVCSSPRAF